MINRRGYFGIQQRWPNAASELISRCIAARSYIRINRKLSAGDDAASRAR